MSKRPKLLLIADDWEANERYEERLAPHFELLSALFGSDGVRMAAEEQPDLILLDLTMEDMTPEEGCAALDANATSRIIPRVVISDGDCRATKRLSRPYQFEELINTLKTISGI